MNTDHLQSKPIMKIQNMKTIVAPTLLAMCITAMAWLSIAEVLCRAESSTSPPNCCPKCGCHECLIPVCHLTCTTKKETKYRYCCKCETICIPDHCPCGSGCDDCKNCGCADQSCTKTSGDWQYSKCSCLIKTVYKLVKIPYTVEIPVRKCTIEWTCPKCGCTERAEPPVPPATGFQVTDQPDAIK